MNIDSSGKREDRLLYEPSMMIIGWLPVIVVAWVLALLLYFMYS